MQQLPLEKDKRRGAMLVLAALMCLILIPISGLVVDGTNAYTMRLELSTALDAAVLAGARSLNGAANLTLAEQTANATTVATNVFNANISAMNGRFNSVALTNLNVDTSQAHVRTVSAGATAVLPLIMMKMLNFSTTTINVKAQAQRRDVNVMLVLDHSGSMKAVISQMQTDAIAFVQMFASGRDNLGLVTFGGAEFTAYTPKTTFLTDSPNVPTIIGLINSYGATNTASAIWAAYQQLVQLQTVTGAGALNVIVLFTDGLANTFTGDFDSLVASSAGCSGLTSPLDGSITVLSNGAPMGLFDPTDQSLNDKPETRGAPNGNGCASINRNSKNLSNYLLGMPTTNVDGNATNGTATYAPYLKVNLSSIDATDVTNAGLNALDYAANRIRSDATLAPVIYTIGLGGNPGAPPDNTLMARVANDPSSASFNSAQPAGFFAFSPTIAELHTAFLRVASIVTRLAQ
jgi:Mg-chelatase subunit ChlD